MFIRDVMLVPDLDENLLSIGQLMEHGYHLHFGDTTCKIFEKGNPTQLMVEIEMRKNRSFPLSFNYSNELAMKMDVQEDSWLWHRRLGHLNFQSLKHLHQHDMVHGLPKIQEVNEVCEGCALGKQHRDSFPQGKP
ncbi:hypothetical protein M0R45_024816 [Rubus argutus]|uniref:GAG-pre-integrase domain-containing protein n=1 Tax=Rubus argutus TaxID=59490 RepID=A0AAW1WUC2_RUBAR